LIKKSLSAVFLALIIAASAFSFTYSEDFFGINTGLTKLNPETFFEEGKTFSGMEGRIFVTYGPKLTSPIRFRLGVGMIELISPYLIGGVELKMFEIINDFHAKSFGVYFILGTEVSLSELFFSGQLEAFIPFSTLGGIQIGLGMRNDLSFSLSLYYSAGIFALQK